jgi:hypothetical protein
MYNFIKKSLSYIVTGSCSIVFAACYGPPTRLENPKHLNIKSPDNEVIKGLKVTLFENRKAIDEKYTNESGSVEFNFSQKDKYNYTALIEDVDGIENGEFQSQNADLTKDSYVEVNMKEQK